MQVSHQNRSCFFPFCISTRSSKTTQEAGHGFQNPAADLLHILLKTLHHLTIPLMGPLSTFLQPNIVKVTPNIANILYNVAVRYKKIINVYWQDFPLQSQIMLKHTDKPEQVDKSVTFQHIRSKREQKGRKKQKKKKGSFYQFCFNLFQLKVCKNHWRLPYSHLQPTQLAQLAEYALS